MKKALFCFACLCLIGPSFNAGGQGLLTIMGKRRTTAIDHILITGQSNSSGADALSPLTVTQPYSNKMFVGSVRAMSGGLGSLVPLVESQTVDFTDYANCGETIASAMANSVTRRNTSKSFLVSQHGASAYVYAAIAKGTSPYALGMSQVTAGKSLVEALGKTYAVRAVCLLHGETDDFNLNSSYQANLVTLQSDYQNDIQAITGQSGTIPLLIDQISAWNWASYGNKTTAVGPYYQLGAAEAQPSKIYLVGPRYFLTHTNGHHLTAVSQRKWGEYFAKVYEKVVIQGSTWRPVSPQTISRSGAIITIDFYVPVPPLAIDTTLVSEPSTSGGLYGFEYTDDSGSPPTITAVTLTGASQVQITLSSTPSGSNKKIRYAYTGVVNSSGGGPTTGPRGNLRDSDTRGSLYGNALYNWCVHFNKDVN